MSRRGWVLRTAYDGPLTSASRPDAYGRPRARHGASSFPKRPGWMCAAPRYPLRPYSSTAARGGLALGASPRPSEGSLGGDDTATMRAPPWPSTAPKALRMVLVLGLQRRRRGWSRGFPTVDAKWPAGARAKNQVDIESVNFPLPWTHTFIGEIITQDLLITMGSCLLSVGHFGGILAFPLCPPPAAASSPRIGIGARS